MERRPPVCAGLYENGELLSLRLEVGVAERALKGEDRSLVRAEDGFFAVFDGASGLDNGDLAADIAQSTLFELPLGRRPSATMEDIPFLKQDLINIMQQASLNVTERAKGGITTGAAARVIAVHGEEQATEAYVVWASAGDSRIYVYSDGKIEQLSRDEGHRNIITNYLGSIYDSKSPCVVSQTGHKRLNHGDKVLLVSDGITGDFDPDILTDYEIAAVCASGSQDVAEKLVAISRKQDDKTALVVGVSVG